MQEMMARWIRHVAVAGALAVAAATAGWAQSAPVYVVERGDTLFKIAREHGLTVAQLKAYNGLQSDALSVGQRLVLRPEAAAETPETPVQTVELPPPPPSDVPLDTALDEPADTAPVDEPPIDPETGLPVDEFADEPSDVGPSRITTMDGRELVLDPPEPIPAEPPPPPPPPATISRVRIGAGTSGQVVIPSPSAAGPQTHVVQRGETLFAIARRYGTTVDALRRLNALRGDALAVGQQLTVAEGARSAAPEPQRSGWYDVTATTLPDDQVHTVRKGETLYSIAARYGTTVGRLLAVNTLTTAPLAAGALIALPDSVGVEHYREPAPLPEADEVGLALVYPDSYEGRETISGEPYDPAALTASHRTLPFGTVLLVTMPATGRSTLVRVNDRGPVSEGFLIELSEAAAEALGQNRGAAEKVEVRIVR